MKLPNLDLLRQTINIDSLDMHSPLKAAISSFNKTEVVHKKETNSSINISNNIKDERNEI